jgi:preprotein translocase subunit Sec63
VDAQTDGVDPLRRSYAILGLEAGASLAEVRRRYRFLASRWHPDRHVGDQRNEAEAGAQMRRINDAYHLIVAKRASEAPHSATVPPVGRRLSPDEVDALAKAIGNEGPIDWLLGTVGWMGSRVQAVYGVLFGVGLAVRVTQALWQRDLGVFRAHPELVLILALVLLVVGREYWTRSRVLESVSQHTERPSSGAAGRRTRG